jgi:hypothetical protein
LLQCSVIFDCYSARPYFDCYSAQPFCDFVILNLVILLHCSVILWFCYNYLNHFVILSAIFYTLNSTIFYTVISNFLIATVLSHFVILPQLPQSFCDHVSNFLYTELNLFSYSAQPFFDCYSARSFCDFCYNYLSHFVILSAIFCTLSSAIFFAIVLGHSLWYSAQTFLIATVLGHFSTILEILSAIFQQCSTIFQNSSVIF